MFTTFINWSLGFLRFTLTACYTDDDMVC